MCFWIKIGIISHAEKITEYLFLYLVRALTHTERKEKLQYTTILELQTAALWNSESMNERWIYKE